ncbi:hypothetical protein A7K91_19860 [Paenibacillus oryzae]|uniref:Uncharacterized protein n=1 Tax=Paenibacillus oryzae TaxID=1844972 RepID=A0A1A5YI43_9BACL|nr:hypothetical protein [Paenibacillus oryzae]OBR65244.1 hypothetical protein A7K91_19860 [Paenibacillus oryzae]
MLDLKLAKSRMENEEGMNHLWIQLFRDEKIAEKSEIQIRLPEGIYRSPNLNGYVENAREHIVIDGFDRDVIIELFTQEAVPCGERSIEVSLLTAGTTISKEISIPIVLEDDMDRVEIDEQVVERVKELSNAGPAFDMETTMVNISPRILKKSENEYSYLEKKYRIDY